MSSVIKGFEWIPLDKLLPQEEELKVRPVVKDPAYEQLVTSIRGMGLVTPFLVTPTREPKGLFVVLGGNRRLEAAKEAFAGRKDGEKTPIPCIKATEGMSALDQIVLAAIDNFHRENFTPSQVYGITKTLRKMGISSQAKMAKMLGLSEPYLSQVLSAGRSGRIQRGGPVRSRPSIAVRKETFDCPYPKSLTSNFHVRVEESESSMEGDPTLTPGSDCKGKIERAWDDEAGTYTYAQAGEAHARRS